MNNKPNIQGSPAAQLRIVRAARTLFQRFGYAKTSMQEIAAASQMSAANLYRYHEGKLAIAAAVVTVEQNAAFETCDQAVKLAGSDMTARLIALFQCNIDLTRRKIQRARLLCELSMITARERPELREELLGEFERRIAAILLQVSQPSAFELAAIKLQSRMILLASAPFVLPWLLASEPFGNPRVMVEPLIRSLLPGLTVSRATTANAIHGSISTAASARKRKTIHARTTRGTARSP